MKYKAYIADSVNPYRNLAMEQYLFQFADTDTNILYLWQNDDTVVIGRNQDINAECKVEEFISSGGRIARRRSGGGAVYHDLGNLNFSVIGVRSNMDVTLYQELLIGLIGRFGLNPQYTGRNDIVIDGLKFSGNAFLDDGRVMCQHGTILVDTDIERMSYFLTPDKEKLERHAIKSVSSRVVNLKTFLPDITIEGLGREMLDMVNAQVFSLEADEDLEKLRAKYADNKWIYGGVS